MFGIDNRLVILEDYTTIREWIMEQTDPKPLLALSTFATHHVVHSLDYTPSLAQGQVHLIQHLGDIRYIDEFLCEWMKTIAKELDLDYLELYGDPDEIHTIERPEVTRASNIARAADAIHHAMQITLATNVEEMRNACAECIYCCTHVDGFDIRILDSIIG